MQVISCPPIVEYSYLGVEESFSTWSNYILQGGKDFFC